MLGSLRTARLQKKVLPSILRYAVTVPALHVHDYAPPCVPVQWISESARELVLRRGLTNAATLLLFTEPLSYDSGIVPPNYTQVRMGLGERRSQFV